MTDSLQRQWQMLRLIPREPRCISAAEIQARLSAADFKVTARTIQRDLQGLSGPFPLVMDDRNKPYGWSWKKDGRTFDLPGMDPQTALTFMLVEMFLGDVIPPAVRQSLNPHFRTASEILRERPMRHWAERVRVIRSRQTLKAPDIRGEIMQTVYEALLQQRCFKAHYLKLGSEAADYDVNPLGLVFKDEVGYLVCTLFDYQDIRQLALHRIERADLADKPIKAPKDFDLDDYIRSGKFDYPVGDPIRLVAKFKTSIADYLRETPLSDDQTITALDNEHSLVTASVQNTSQLRWWLLSFGDNVEILKPVALRHEFGGTARKMAAKYQKK